MRSQRQTFRLARKPVTRSDRTDGGLPDGVVLIQGRVLILALNLWQYSHGLVVNCISYVGTVGRDHVLRERPNLF